jgi:hypothetical protein
MAEERNLATARAPEIVRDDDEPTKAELQRRMEEARENISQTVNEIKETVTTKYEDVKESISQTLDWREQFRRRPIAFTVGALSVGAVVGYTIGGVAFGDGGGDDLAGRYYQAEGEADEDGARAEHEQRSYAAQAITGGAYGSTAYAPSPARESSAQDINAESSSSANAAPRPSYSSGYEASPATQSDEPDKPSLYARFKETKAYDRLQDEIGTLGERAVEELSKTARNVVLPALLGKLKDLIGIDLSTQREVAQRSRLEQQATNASTQTDHAASPTGGASSAQGAQGSASYTGGYGKTL